MRRVPRSAGRAGSGRRQAPHLEATGDGIERGAAARHQELGVLEGQLALDHTGQCSLVREDASDERGLAGRDHELAPTLLARRHHGQRARARSRLVECDPAVRFARTLDRARPELDSRRARQGTFPHGCDRALRVARVCRDRVEPPHLPASSRIPARVPRFARPDKRTRSGRLLRDTRRRRIRSRARTAAVACTRRRCAFLRGGPCGLRRREERKRSASSRPSRPPYRASRRRVPPPRSRLPSPRRTRPSNNRRTRRRSRAQRSPSRFRSRATSHGRAHRSRSRTRPRFPCPTSAPDSCRTGGRAARRRDPLHRSPRCG